MATIRALRLLFILVVSYCTMFCAASDYPNVITLSYESVLDKSSVKPLATIFYDPKTLKSTISSWTPPTLPSVSANPDTTTSKSSRLFRILLPNGSSTLSSISTFNTSLVQTVSLHTSPNGDGTVYSASVAASEPLPVLPPTSLSKSKVQKPAEVDSSVNVKIIPPKTGPIPKLNTRKPPVIGADGREVKPEGEVAEKTFFQRYWWAFILVAVVAMAGGGDK